MNTDEKRKILVLLAAIAASMILIAGALPELKPGKGMPLPLRGETSAESGITSGATTDGGASVDGNYAAFILILFTSGLLYSLYKVIRLLGWKELRKILTVFIPVGILLFLVFGVFFLMTRRATDPGVNERQVPTAIEAPGTPLGPVPGPLLLIVGSAAVALVLFAGFRIASGKNGIRRPALALGLEAERARRALAGGADLRNVITECYRGMGAAVENGRGLSRAESMTPGEFEALLEAEGIGRESVRELTRLFESVRYGDRRPDPAEEHAAMRCLETIISGLRADGNGKNGS